MLFCVLFLPSLDLLVILVRLSVPVQVSDWKDYSTCYVLMEMLDSTHSLCSMMYPVCTESAVKAQTSHQPPILPAGFCADVSVTFIMMGPPCGLQVCKNRPAPFPGRMSYKATKPGLVLFYILACFNCIVAY